MTSKQIYQALLNGKEVKSESGRTFKLIHDELHEEDFFGNYVKLPKEKMTIVEPIKVKEGQVYALKDASFVVVKTGETTLRLVNQSTWTTDGNNYYGATKDSMEKKGYLCVKLV